MELLRILVLLTVTTVALSISPAMMRARVRRLRMKIQQQRQERRQQNGAPSNQQGGNSDPSDLSTLLKAGRCARDFDVNSLFSSMFTAPNDAEAVLPDNPQADPRVRSMGAASTVNGQIMSYRSFKGTSTDVNFNTFNNRASPAASEDTCCETQMNITAPSMVMVNGKMVSIVHMNHSYQFVQEGECVNPGATCRGVGACTQRYKYAFMLAYDPELAGKVSPPVSFVRVQVKSHCECMNIGRVMAVADQNGSRVL